MSFVVSEDDRILVIRTLNWLYSPVPVEDLAACIEVMAGVVISPGTIATLAAGDEAAFAGGDVRDVWICPALRFPNGFRVDDFLTRSDWPVTARFVDDGLSEAQQLLLLRQFCDAIAIGEERGFMEGLRGQRLLVIVNELAARLPRPQLEQMASRWPSPPGQLVLYRELAEDLYGPMARTERETRRQAAQTLESLSLPERFFGV